MENDLFLLPIWSKESKDAVTEYDKIRDTSCAIKLVTK